MKKKLIFILALVLLVFVSIYVYCKYFVPFLKIEEAQKLVKELTINNKIQEGDLIFQTSQSRQSKAIQAATHSKYSHCGIIFKNNNEFFVFEAVQPVKYTPLDKWIARGKEGEYVIKRLKDSERILTPAIIEKMKNIADEFKGKSYDLTFEWSDDRIYCSELIWKIYKRATNLELGILQKLKDFDLSDPSVSKIMNERYGNNVPLDEIVISPVSIFESDLLRTVKEK